MQDPSSLLQVLKHSSLPALFEQVFARLKQHPSDTKSREVLFKLYCIEGLWDKALAQLQTLALMDETLQKRVELYQNLVLSEIQRGEVLSGIRSAGILQEKCPEWMEMLQQANHAHFQENNVESAAVFRQEAFDLVQESAGHGDAVGAFTWIADSDSRLGPICEFICAGGYRWVPFSDIQFMNVSDPKDIIDLIWISASLTSGGETWYGYIPTRYPVEPEDTLSDKLGLCTKWTELSDTLVVGRGRKMLVTDNNEYAILETGHVTFGSE